MPLYDEDGFMLDLTDYKDGVAIKNIFKSQIVCYW